MYHGNKELNTRVHVASENKQTNWIASINHLKAESSSNLNRAIASSKMIHLLTMLMIRKKVKSQK